MRYYWLKLTHQHGTTYLKTVAQSIETAIQNCIDIEGCDISQLQIKEVKRDLFSLELSKHFESARGRIGSCIT